jgi:hypothetical protein
MLLRAILCAKTLHFRTLISEIEKYIINGIRDRENMPSEKRKTTLQKMTLEDINEYYGVVSTITR